MEANRVGRTMGVGTRLLGRMLRDKTVESAARTAAHVEKQAPVYKERGRRLGQGSRRFGQSMWGPFAHASRQLWLEITGLFFFVFAIFFGGHTWELRAQWAAGPSHTRFLLYSLITLVFVYFAVSSFVRAARHNRVQRKNR
jgi:hypothetical protein